MKRKWIGWLRKKLKILFDLVFKCNLNPKRELCYRYHNCIMPVLMMISANFGGKSIFFLLAGLARIIMLPQTIHK